MCTSGNNPAQSKWFTFLPTVMASLLSIAIPALIGFIFAYYANKRDKELEFVNSQIEKLYGPLYALSQSNETSYQYFRTVNAGNDYKFECANVPTDAQVEQWRAWNKGVFQPNNAKMSQIIVDNSQLILGDTMPETFERMVAHTGAYKVVMDGWKEKDKEITEKLNYRAPMRNIAPSYKYPTNILSCARLSYSYLKRKQQFLKSQLLPWGSFEGFVQPAACNNIEKINLEEIKSAKCPN